MADATLAQMDELVQLAMREKREGRDSGAFVQRWVESIGLLQRIGKGELTQASVLAALESHIKGDRQLYGWYGQNPCPENPYAGQHVEPVAFYAYDQVMDPIEKQVAELEAALGRPLDKSNLEQKVKMVGARVPLGADGPFPQVSVKLHTLAKFAGQDAIDRKNCGPVIEQTLLAGLQRQLGDGFKNSLAGQMIPKDFRIGEAAWLGEIQLEARQPEGDLGVAWVQSGRLGASCSPFLCQYEIEHALYPKQWSWSVFRSAQYLLANRRRLARYEDLCIDNPGDEISPGAVDRFDLASYFLWGVGQLHCGSRWHDDPDDDFGSGSAFAQ